MKIFGFRWWLWYQVCGNFDKFEQHSSKSFSFPRYVRMVKFSYGCTIEKMLKTKSKLLQILPTCNPILENKNFIDLTYGWNECFFESKGRNFMKIIVFHVFSRFFIEKRSILKQNLVKNTIEFINFDGPLPIDSCNPCGTIG